MIGTIRKHTVWLWWLIAGATIISFVIFMGAGPARNGGRGGGEDTLGLLYDRPITADDYNRTYREFSLNYWFQNQEWPDRSPSISKAQIAERVYEHLLLTRKAAELGVHVSDEAISTEAAQVLSRLGRGQPVTPEQFEQNVLKPVGLTLADFQNFIRTDLIIQQLMQTVGMPGTFVTPQEAGDLYDRDTREVSAQAVFFSWSNHLSQATPPTAAIAQFYTNNMSYYRLPDRVQVGYVYFNVTNFLAQSKAEWAKTNFDDTVDAVYRQYGATEFANEKSPDAAKAKIRQLLIRQRAMSDAGAQAKVFVTALFAMEPVSPQNLLTLAKSKGVVSGVTEPFSETYGPREFNAPDKLTQDAFGLTADDPFDGPIAGTDGVYVISLINKLPSAVPEFDIIKSRVAEDMQRVQAMAMAQSIGTNFYFTVATAMASGKSFAQATLTAGQTPEILPPFSLASAEIPGFDTRAELGQLKRAAFTTPEGRISPFMPTDEGGFVLYVQSFLPVDQVKKAADLPQYISQLRQARRSEAFSLWFNGELNRELPKSPYFQQQLAAGK